MNKRILLSSLSIFSSLAIAAGATFAFFSDDATSSGNTFTSGSMTLLLNGEEDLTTAVITASDLAPGDSTAGDIGLSKDPSSTDIAKVGFNVSATNPTLGDDLLLQVYEGATESAGECTGGTEITSDIVSGLTTAGPLTVNNFAGEFFDSLFDTPGFSNVSTNNLCFKVKLDDDATAQGVTSDVTFNFQALQDPGQTPTP